MWPPCPDGDTSVGERIAACATRSAFDVDEANSAGEPRTAPVPSSTVTLGRASAPCGDANDDAGVAGDTHPTSGLVSPRVACGDDGDPSCCSVACANSRHSRACRVAPEATRARRCPLPSPEPPSDPTSSPLPRLAPPSTAPLSSSKSRASNSATPLGLVVASEARDESSDPGTELGDRAAARPRTARRAALAKPLRSAGDPGASDDGVDGDNTMLRSRLRDRREAWRALRWCRSGDPAPIHSASPSSAAAAAARELASAAAAPVGDDADASPPYAWM